MKTYRLAVGLGLGFSGLAAINADIKDSDCALTEQLVFLLMLSAFKKDQTFQILSF